MVRPRSKVVRLARLPGGGWRLDLADPLRRGAPAGSITAREVVLSAGVLGTTELLLASRDRWRTLPWASPALGTHVRTNSEAFTAVLQPAGGPDVTDGATISSDFHPDDLDPRHQQPVPALVRVHAVVPVPTRGRRHPGLPGASDGARATCAIRPVPRRTHGHATGTVGSPC